MRLVKITISLFLVAMVMVSCNSSMRVMATWVDKDKVKALPPGPHTVFIFVITQNYEAQVTLENDLAKAAEAKGVKVYKSIDVFGPIIVKDKLPQKDVILKSIRDLGCDAIYTVAVVDKQSETRYVPGTMVTGAYSPYGYTPYGGYGYSYGGYYAYSTAFYTPGYYSTDKTYFIESNLFNAKTEELLIASQSKLVNPPEIPKASKQYTALLVEDLQSRGFLQGKAKSK